MAKSDFQLRVYCYLDRMQSEVAAFVDVARQ